MSFCFRVFSDQSLIGSSVAGVLPDSSEKFARKIVLPCVFKRSERRFVARAASLPAKKCRASSLAAFARQGIVVHSHEIKPFRRGDHAAAAAVARVERGAQIGGVPFAGADMFERAGDRAHLGMQKRSRAYADLNFFAG